MSGVLVESHASAGWKEFYYSGRDLGIRTLSLERPELIHSEIRYLQGGAG
jgi:hypothetical protein